MRSLKNWVSRTTPIEEKTSVSDSLHLSLLAYGIRKRYDYYEINVPYLMYVEGKSVIQHREGGRGVQVALLSNGHNSILEAGDIPSTIKVIMFGKKFNQTLDNLPGGIEFLIFPEDGDFNRPLENLPVSLRGLLLNRSYKLQLGLVPAGVKYINIGCRPVDPRSAECGTRLSASTQGEIIGTVAQPRLFLDTLN